MTSRRSASQSRSRSPEQSDRHRANHQRSRSPYVAEKSQQSHRRGHHHHHKRRKRSSEALHQVVLPFGAVSLSKHDLREYRPLFATYIDIHKQKVLDDMDEGEVKGRWKSFVQKWNRGELAEGWYDPQMLKKAIERAATPPPRPDRKPVRKSPERETGSNSHDDEDDDYGPSLPPSTAGAVSGTGPKAATFEELTLRDEQSDEAAYGARNMLRKQRKADRMLQKERLEELAPRAEPGTRERQIEKRRENAASNRAFAESKGTGTGSGMEDVGENELMGNEGGVDEVKKMKAQQERKKNEREVRREEILRARAAEREERVAAMKAKEDKTMDMLKAIAKERFG